MRAHDSTAGDDRSLYVSFTRLWRYHYAMTSPPIRQPVRIIGIDPGLRRTGWGVIESEGNRLIFIGCGSVEPPDESAAGEPAAGDP